jgi:hypothetical protein
LVKTKSKMIAPNPQQMQSRKDRLKLVISLRRSLLLFMTQGQFLEGVRNEPPDARASFQ